MGIIQLKEANCKSCYRCIRECPVKSISFKDDQARVMEKECILCGKCILICPQNAKEVVSDLDKVKSFVGKKDKVYASVAPSFASYFKGWDFSALSSVLKKLGFLHVEETAVGASKVSKEYERLLREGKMKNIITSACPSVVLLMEKYYSDLLDQLAPTVSPMIAHARTMREVYGTRIKIIFIGPCISKKHEADDVFSGGLVSAAITFEELKQWMEESGVNPSSAGSEQKNIRNPSARFYPAPGGIIRTLSREDRKSYKCISVDGVDRCMEILDSIRKGEVSGYFIEMNACAGGCIGGPCMRASKISFIRAKDDLIQAARPVKDAPDYATDNVETHLNRTFIDRSVSPELPDEKAIKKILESIGKTSPQQELNCGGCGYNTCRDKAVAVYQGKADPKMCLPFVRERAESISNQIIEYTPNAIIATDKELTIQEINPAALTMLKRDRGSMIGQPVEMFLPGPDYEQVIHRGRVIRNLKQTYEALGVTVEQTVIYIKEQQLLFMILKDITHEEKKQQSIDKVREETLEVAQKVIDKQMRVAQEIASLLGETTAETKIALTRLKKSIVKNTGEGL